MTYDFDTVMSAAQKQEMSAESEAAIKHIHSVLKSKGFTYDRESKQSALYHRRYTRGTRSIEISGWHGTGRKGTCRWFGDLKTLFCLFDSVLEAPIMDSFPYMVHGKDGDASLANAIETHRRGIARAKNYVDSLFV